MPEVSVWAPHAARVRVAIAEPGEPVKDPLVKTDLKPSGDGWWRADLAEAVPGREYGFLLDEDEQVLPDPRSRCQPRGVHQPSRFYADDFGWTDTSWPGHDLPDSVIYELHIGTFTQTGTFDAAIERLDHLVDLGVTHVELLPVNDFNGTWNWGYDGVLWYAVHEAYGGPDGLKRFVDACHGAGLAVVLDVVYNHLGASGNYLPRFGPYFKTGRSTWGELVNLDGESAGPVREYIIGNALMSGERQAYYADYGSLSALAKVLTRAFFHDGIHSTFEGHLRGKPVDTEHTPGYRFVVCLQNHDQVGNRAAGDRLPRITSPGMLKVGATLLLTSPFTPMLWMGEEWSASTPWPFFTSHPEPEMAEATATGRVDEFAEHGWNADDVVNPQDPESFTSAKLRWSERDDPEHSEILAIYGQLLTLRREHPDLADSRLNLVEADFDEDAGWIVVHRGAFDVVANLSGDVAVLPTASRVVLFGTEPGLRTDGRTITLPARSAAITGQIGATGF